jgi:hypothetical protein
LSLKKKRERERWKECPSSTLMKGVLVLERDGDGCIIDIEL